MTSPAWIQRLAVPVEIPCEWGRGTAFTCSRPVVCVERVNSGGVIAWLCEFHERIRSTSLRVEAKMAGRESKP